MAQIGPTLQTFFLHWPLLHSQMWRDERQNEILGLQSRDSIGRRTPREMKRLEATSQRDCRKQTEGSTGMRSSTH